jgi:DNA-3-methyladenine glycosylase
MRRAKSKCSEADLPTLALESRLGRSFYERPVLEVAEDLIGCTIWSHLGGNRTAGLIVECEAYAGGSDLASHAARLKRGRVESMSGPPGFTYVYRSHGIHSMLNVVAEPEASTAAILIRALEPRCGIDVMRERRGLNAVEALCSGPGKLCQALGISLDDHQIDLVSSEQLWIEQRQLEPPISISGRIGISRDRERLWRYFETGSRFVSSHRRGTPIDRASDTIRSDET